MSRNEKMKFIRLIEGSELCISDALAKYDVPRSTYYRWKRKVRSQGINGQGQGKKFPCNDRAPRGRLVLRHVIRSVTAYMASAGLKSIRPAVKYR